MGCTNKKKILQNLNKLTVTSINCGINDTKNKNQ